MKDCLHFWISCVRGFFSILVLFSVMFSFDIARLIKLATYRFRVYVEYLRTVWCDATVCCLSASITGWLQQWQIPQVCRCSTLPDWQRKAGCCTRPVTSSASSEWRSNTGSKSPSYASRRIRSTTDVIPDSKWFCADDDFALPTTCRHGIRKQS